MTTPRVKTEFRLVVAYVFSDRPTGTMLPLTAPGSLIIASLQLPPRRQVVRLVVAAPALLLLTARRMLMLLPASRLVVIRRGLRLGRMRLCPI